MDPSESFNAESNGRFIPPNRSRMGNLLEAAMDREFARLYERHAHRVRSTYQYNPLNHSGFDHYFTKGSSVIAVEDKNCSGHYQIAPSWLTPNVFQKWQYKNPVRLFFITCGAVLSIGAKKKLEELSLFITHFHHPKALRSWKDICNRRFQKWLRGICAYIFDYLNPAKPKLSIYYTVARSSYNNNRTAITTTSSDKEKTLRRCRLSSLAAFLRNFLHTHRPFARRIKESFGIVTYVMHFVQRKYTRLASTLYGQYHLWYVARTDTALTGFTTNCRGKLLDTSESTFTLLFLMLYAILHCIVSKTQRVLQVLGIKLVLFSSDKDPPKLTDEARKVLYDFE